MAANGRDKDRDAFGKTVINQIDDYAPGFKDLILHMPKCARRASSKAKSGLTEGNIFQGELTFDQLLFNRPVPGAAQYRSPIKDLWMCGSSTHPGGGVMGAPGRNAAAEILRDLKKPLPDERRLCRPMMPSSSAAAPTASPPQAGSPRQAARFWCWSTPLSRAAARDQGIRARLQGQRRRPSPQPARSACRAGARSQGHGLAFAATNISTTALSPTGDHLVLEGAYGETHQREVVQKPIARPGASCAHETDALCRRAAAPSRT